MATKDNASVARALHDGYNRRDFDVVKKHVDEDSTFVDVAAGTTLRGVSGYRQYMEGWATALPDSKTEILNVFSDGDRVAVEFLGRGTHDGPLNGPQGTIAPTGKRVEIHVNEVYDFKNGKVVGMRQYYDATTLMKQLGLMP